MLCYFHYDIIFSMKLENDFLNKIMKYYKIEILHTFYLVIFIYLY